MVSAYFVVAQSALINIPYIIRVLVKYHWSR